MQDLGRNKTVIVGTEHDIVFAEANSAVPLKGDSERMARRRFQRGQLVCAESEVQFGWDVIEKTSFEVARFSASKNG
jgi:hypothetical protein